MSAVNAGGLSQAWLHWCREAALRVRSHISPGPYRSFRELSLAGSVDPDIWCPPTFVGNSGIECFNGERGLALFHCSIFTNGRTEIEGRASRHRARGARKTLRQAAHCGGRRAGETRFADRERQGAARVGLFADQERDRPG